MGFISSLFVIEHAEVNIGSLGVEAIRKLVLKSLWSTVTIT